MLNFNSILIFSEKPKELAEFYKSVLVKDAVMIEEGYTTYEGGNCWLTIGPHEKVMGKNPNPERIMLNFETEELQDEFDRIKELGATVIKAPDVEAGGVDAIATFADPHGNIFQLVPPFDAMAMQPE